jgi:hypothetical protein
MRSGHYTFILYDNEGENVKNQFDDEFVNDGGPDINTIQEAAYILLYKREDIQSGGTINTISKENESKWKNKYLKYKQKYLNLVKEI